MTTSSASQEHHAQQKFDRASWGASWHELDKTRYFGSIITGSMLMRTIMYPFAVLKTRQQFLKNDPSAKATASTFSQLRSIAANEGVRSLYRGFALSTSVGIFLSPVWLSSLEVSRTLYKDVLGAPPTMASTLAAVTSTLATQTVFVPLDNITQRLMVHEHRARAATSSSSSSSAVSDAAAAAEHHASSSSAAGSSSTRTTTTTTTAAATTTARSEIEKLWKQGGILRFWRGYPLSVAVWAPTGMIFWPTFTNLRGVLTALVSSRQHNNNDNSNDNDNNTSSNINNALAYACTPFSACVAGAFASALTTPCDVVKTRVQLTHNRPALEVARELMRKEGMGGFFLGMKSRMIQSMVMYSLMMSGYDVIKFFSTVAK